MLVMILGPLGGSSTDLAQQEMRLHLLARLATHQGLVPVLPSIPRARHGGAWLPRKTAGEEMVRLWRAVEAPLMAVVQSTRGKLWVIEEHGLAGNPWRKTWGRWGGGDRDVVGRSWAEWSKQLRGAGLGLELEQAEADDDVALEAIDALRRCARLVESIDDFQGQEIAGDTVPQANHLDRIADALEIRAPRVLGQEVPRG